MSNCWIYVDKHQKSISIMWKVHPQCWSGNKYFPISEYCSIIDCLRLSVIPSQSLTILALSWGILQTWIFSNPGPSSKLDSTRVEFFKISKVMDQMFLGCRMEGPNRYLWHQGAAWGGPRGSQILTKILKHLWASLGMVWNHLHISHMSQISVRTFNPAT